MAGSPKGRAGLPGPVAGVAQHLQAGFSRRAARPRWARQGGGGGQRARGHQPRGRLGGTVGLGAVALVGAGLAGMARLGVDGGDDPVWGDPPGDPPGPWPLAWLDVLACHQRQQRDRLGLLGVVLQVGDRVECGQRVVDQPRQQRLGGLRIIPGAVGLAWPGSSWATSSTPRACGTRRRTRRITATSWVTVSWVATASARMVASSSRRRRPRSTPVASITWPTASKIRRGLGQARRRLRQDTSTVGCTPSSSSRNPQATFQARSRRNAPMASRSDRPSRACSTSTVATTSAGTKGCPPPWRARSANSSGGNSW